MDIFSDFAYCVLFFRTEKSAEKQVWTSCNSGFCDQFSHILEQSVKAFNLSANIDCCQSAKRMTFLHCFQNLSEIDSEQLSFCHFQQLSTLMLSVSVKL